MMSTEDIISVAIVEDDTEMRTTLRHLIEGTGGFSCIGTFGSCEEALPVIVEERPDVILMDINLPGMSGIEGVRKIKEKYPEANILMQTVYQDDDNIFQSICAGAMGYLLKRTSREQLLGAIREVYGGGAPMNAGIARRVMELFRKTAAPVREESSLTPREIDILKSLVDGCSYKMIADRHTISLDTVRNHIKHIYDKLHVHSKSEAVVKALKERLV